MPAKFVVEYTPICIRLLFRLLLLLLLVLGIMLLSLLMFLKLSLFGIRSVLGEDNTRDWISSGARGFDAHNVLFNFIHEVFL